MKYHTIELCGLKRKLPLTHISRKTQFASFTILGDVELVNRLADVLAEKLKDYKFDYLVGPEVKVVPLIQALAERLNHKRFVICRKSVKPYMTSSIVLKPLSHFPKHVRQLVIDGSDAKLIKNKKVVIVDDVVSTGVTMRMMNHLMKKVGASVILCLTVLKQGKQFDEIQNLFTLGTLPIFKKT